MSVNTSRVLAGTYKSSIDSRGTPSSNCIMDRMCFALPRVLCGNDDICSFIANKLDILVLISFLMIARSLP